VNPLLYACALELRNRTEHASYESSRGGAGVDSFAESYEGDPSGLPFVEQQNEMPEVAAETVESPADDTTDFVAANVGSQLIESWPAVLGAADAVVDVLDGLPAACLDVPADSSN
jgi:hypothetical protein